MVKPAKNGKKLGAATVSVTVNLLFLISKIIVAFLTGSVGLYAESAHSFFDLLASVLAFAGITKADEPEDETHHFGHEKFENLSSFVQAVLILGTAGAVLFEAYQRFSTPAPLLSSEIGIVLMIISIPLTLWTSNYLDNVAKKEGSAALEADAAHFTTDVLSSFSVLAGLLLSRLGYPIGDPIAATIVGLIMFYTGCRLIYGSFVVFLDFSPSAETMDIIREVLDNEEKAKRIIRYHKLRARMSGSKIHVDLHIHLRYDLPLHEAHLISHEIEADILEKVPKVKEVTIHIEPD